MERPRPKPSSIAAAVSLAVLTLFVFWVLRWYGPESAIRQYHVAVMRKDLAMMRGVTGPAIYTPENAALAGRVEGLLKQGASVRIRTVQRTSTVAQAEVEYALGEQRIPTLWIVVKRGPAWQIDPAATLFSISRRMF